MGHPHQLFAGAVGIADIMPAVFGLARAGDRCDGVCVGLRLQFHIMLLRVAGGLFGERGLQVRIDNSQFGVKVRLQPRDLDFGLRLDLLMHRVVMCRLLIELGLVRGGGLCLQLMSLSSSPIGFLVLRTDHDRRA